MYNQGMSDISRITGHMQNPQKKDIALITRAYECARDAHKGHKRYSGDPYLTHPVAVATMLAQMGMGPRTIAAGLLHDIVEDTPVTRTAIQETFGEEVLFLVDGVTKLGAVRYYGSDRHNESLRKLFVAVSQDIRVLIIKLVDRLHNMQTLSHVPKEKQERIARETLEIYVPVAHRLGMGRIRKELEDLAFPYVYPQEHERVTALIRPHAKRSSEQLEKASKSLKKRLAEKTIQFRTELRVKGTYSLFQKLKRRDWDPERIYDYLAIRVIVSNVETCYQVLGIIHELWRPMPQRVKDYIAFPKPNGYQSIHTTVITPNRTILEIQIRTEQMHRDAEFGIASHIVYKNIQQGMSASAQKQSWFSTLVSGLFRSTPANNTSAQPTDTPQTEAILPKERIPAWIKEIGELHQSAGDIHGFVSDLRSDFFTHRIFAFTPEGDVVDLPVGATPIDFAFAIHSDIGSHTAGAKVNQKLVQLNTPLQNGDIVEIITKKSNQPTPKWLEQVKTSLARRRIRAALSGQHETEMKNANTKLKNG